MNRKMTLRTSATALTIGVAIAGGVLTTSPASADTPPTINSVVTVDGPSGGITGLYGTTCDEVTTFIDDTPSPADSYTVAVTGPDGTARTNTGATPSSTSGTFTISVPCDGLTDGTTYSETLTENAGATSAPTSFTYQLVGHPGHFNVTSQTVNGVDGFTPGKKEVVTFSQGAWESGVTYTTQLWVSKTPTFSAADYDTNVYGTTAIVGAYRRAAPVLSFTVPTTAQGEYVWFTILGHKDGKADERFTLTAVPVHPLRAMPKSWVTFHDASGTPRRGSTVKVAAPTFSATGKKHNLVSHYQWFTNHGINAIDGATGKRYTVGAPLYQGSDLRVRVTVTDANHAPRIKFYRLGTVK